MATPPEYGFEDIFRNVDWRENDLLAPAAELLQAYEDLDDRLMADVQPEDLVVRALATRSQGRLLGYSAGPARNELVMELWSVSEEMDMTVRIAKSLTYDRGWLDVLLTRQVQGTGNWIPTLEKRRTARIAKLAGEASVLAVSLFYKAEIPGDGGIAAMRQIIDADRAGDEEYGQTIKIDKYTIGTMPKDLLRKKATHGSKDLPAVQTACQELVNKHISTTKDQVRNLHTALEIVTVGRRVRPSRAQHRVEA